MKEIGRFLFRIRSYTPLPMVLIYIFLTEVNLLFLIIGAVMIILGELIRLYSVSFIGPISRTRGDSTGNLVETGPYAALRNPLYLGNFFIFMGFVVTSKNWIFILCGLALFVFQYFFIVIYEESTLIKKFGDVYREYKKRVHPFLPNLFKVFDPGNYETIDMKKGLRSERWTLLAALFFTGIPLIFFLFPAITPELKNFLFGLF